MSDFDYIDPRSVHVIGALMMLLNGGVLGLMHRTLATDVQASAFSWRLGTLLLACGCVLQAVQQESPFSFVLPLSHALILIGATCYWRALRQFYGLQERWTLFVPALLALVGVMWFSFVRWDLSARIAINSFVLAFVLLGSTWTLRRFAPRDRTVSRTVLSGVFLVIGLALASRGAQALLHPPTQATVLQLTQWHYMLSLLAFVSLPVMGTTAFLMMCSERIRQQWERAASTDYLTGLANRRTVARAGARAFGAARRHGTSLAVAVIDVDHFKPINDRYGHEVGDLALKHLASVLEDSCRQDDLPGRLGGEEFCLLWERADEAHGLAAAKRFRAELRARPFVPDGTAIVLTVSIGVAALHADDRSFEDLLRRADRALYAAKARGRDRVAVADDAAA